MPAPAGEGAAVAPPAAGRSPARGARSSALKAARGAASPLAFACAVLILWQILSVTGVVNEIFLPPPTELASTFVEVVQTSSFWTSTWVTAQEALLGFVIGVGVAWVLGTLIGMFRYFRYAFYPLIVIFQIMPRVALAPLFLAWFGFGIGSKVVMAATICFFPVIVNVILGLEQVGATPRAMLASYGASKWAEYRRLLFPASLPAVFASLKVAITLALVGAIVAEFLGAGEGMGVLLREYSFQLLIPESFAVLMGLSLLGIVLFGLTVLLERRLIYWRNHGI